MSNNSETNDLGLTPSVKRVLGPPKLIGTVDSVITSTVTNGVVKPDVRLREDLRTQQPTLTAIHYHSGSTPLNGTRPESQASGRRANSPSIRNSLNISTNGIDSARKRDLSPTLFSDDLPSSPPPQIPLPPHHTPLNFMDLDNAASINVECISSSTFPSPLPTSSRESEMNVDNELPTCTVFDEALNSQKDGRKRLSRLRENRFGLSPVSKANTITNKLSNFTNISLQAPTTTNTFQSSKQKFDFCVVGSGTNQHILTAPDLQTTDSLSYYGGSGVERFVKNITSSTNQPRPRTTSTIEGRSLVIQPSSTVSLASIRLAGRYASLESPPNNSTRKLSLGLPDNRHRNTKDLGSTYVSQKHPRAAKLSQSTGSSPLQKFSDSEEDISKMQFTEMPWKSNTRTCGNALQCVHCLNRFAQVWCRPCAKAYCLGCWNRVGDHAKIRGVSANINSSIPYESEPSHQPELMMDSERRQFGIRTGTLQSSHAIEMTSPLSYSASSGQLIPANRNQISAREVPEVAPAIVLESSEVAEQSLLAIPTSKSRPQSSHYFLPSPGKTSFKTTKSLSTFGGTINLSSSQYLPSGDSIVIKALDLPPSRPSSSMDVERVIPLKRQNNLDLRLSVPCGLSHTSITDSASVNDDSSPLDNNESTMSNRVQVEYDWRSGQYCPGKLHNIPKSSPSKPITRRQPVTLSPYT